MKKNRNAFFNESNTSFQGYNPGFMPYQMNANSSFSAGNMMMPNMAGNDYEERLAKIERQINRLDKRVSNLESSSIKSTDDFESQTNNMYMI